MKNNEVTLSKKKMIIFGIIVDLIVSTIMSLGAYDLINACYGEIMPLLRIHFFLAVFPNMLVIIGVVLISYTLLSIKSNQKNK